MQSYSNRELSVSSSKLSELVNEYACLFTLPTFDEAQSNRFNEILELACENSQLHFWLSEVEHILGHELGYFEHDLSKKYSDQKAQVREHFIPLDIDGTEDLSEDFYKILTAKYRSNPPQSSS